MVSYRRIKQKEIIINSFKTSFELNLSAKDSSVKIIRYYQPVKKKFDSLKVKKKFIARRWVGVANSSLGGDWGGGGGGEEGGGGL